MEAVTLGREYAERVYAGVLGKIIGVYLGRPFEGWEYRDILAKLGEIDYYVHDRLDRPLIVTDDDISGTFTFLRALEDYGYDPNLTARQIGQTWLNYLIEGRTVLWWGGMGMSTEHTAYLRLKHGVTAPESGSIALNGKVVAEQIGAQIFIDGWGLVNPGDPERAAHFARLAGSVSHDGEAIYGAQVQAALIAQAFVESDIDRLLDTATALIPSDSIIARMIADIREWHAAQADWQANFLKIEGRYGYDKYGGNCHMVPNHGLIVHALLHGNGDFQRSLKIVNTCGWDTDCNSGNVGCILGVRNGLAGIDAGPDWRGPVADRMYLPTADGGRGVTDAVQETDRIVLAARRLRNLPAEPQPRFHFSYPGAVQGFKCEGATMANEAAALVLRLDGKARATTETFPGATARKMGGYGLFASPTLYSGDRVEAAVRARQTNDEPIRVAIVIGVANEKDEVSYIAGVPVEVLPGKGETLEFKVPDTHGYPICEVGLEADGEGVLRFDWIDWSSAPTIELGRCKGTLWRQAWVNGMSEFHAWGETYRMIQNEGTGLMIQGTREWTDYRMSADVCPHLAEFAGIAARVQGMRRYYALVLHRSGEVRLVKALDGETVLASKPLPWEFGQRFELQIEVEGGSIRGYIDGRLVVEAQDADLASGAVAYVLNVGRMGSDRMRVEALRG